MASSVCSAVTSYLVGSGGHGSARTRVGGRADLSPPGRRVEVEDGIGGAVLVFAALAAYEHAVTRQVAGGEHEAARLAVQARG